MDKKDFANGKTMFTFARTKIRRSLQESLLMKVNY